MIHPSFSRQPGREQDKQLSSGVDSKDEEHIIVATGGHWYSLQVKTNSRWATLEDIYGSLMDLWESSQLEDAPDQGQRLGYLTSMDRNQWAAAYADLSKLGDNEDILRKIADSLMVVCLDEETQNSSDSHRSLKDMFRQMMTGGGSR